MTENIKETISNKTKESRKEKMEKLSLNDKNAENINIIDNYLKQLVNIGNTLVDLRSKSKQEISDEKIANERISSTNENDDVIIGLKNYKIRSSKTKDFPEEKYQTFTEENETNHTKQVDKFSGQSVVNLKQYTDKDDFLESEEYHNSVNVFNDFVNESQEEKTSVEAFQQFPNKDKESFSKNSNIVETENDNLREYFPIIYKTNQKDFIKLQKIFHENLSEHIIDDDNDNVFYDEESDEDVNKYLEGSPSDLKTNMEEPIGNDIYERSYNLFSRSQTIDSVKLTYTYRKPLGDIENALSSKELKLYSDKFILDSDINLQLENSIEKSFSTVSNQFKKASIKTNNFPLDFHQLSELSKMSDNKYICQSGEDINRQLLQTESQETETNYLVSYPFRNNDYEDQSLDNLNYLSLSASLKNEASSTFNDFPHDKFPALKRVFIKTVNSTNKVENEEMAVPSIKYNLLQDYFPELDPNIIAQINNLKAQSLRLPSIQLDASKDPVTLNKRINTTLQYSNDDELVLRESKMKTQATQFHNLIINGKQLMFRDSDLMTLNSMRKKYPENYNQLKNIFVSAKKLKNEIKPIDKSYAMNGEDETLFQKKEGNCLDSACYKILYGKSSDYSQMLLDAINSKYKSPIKQLSRSKSHEFTTGINKTNLPKASSNVILPQASSINENVLETYSLIAETKTKFQNFNPISYAAGYPQSTIPLPNQIESKSIFERTPAITKKKSYIKTIHTSIVNDAANMNKLLPRVKPQNGDLLNIRDKMNIKKNKILMEKTERRYKKFINEEIKKKTRSDNFIANYSEEYFDSFMNFYDALQVKQNSKIGRHYNLSQKVFRRPSSRISANQDLDFSDVHESPKSIDDKNLEKIYKSYKKPFVISSDHFSKFASNKNIA